MPERPSNQQQDRAARVALTWIAEPGNPLIWAMVQADGATLTLQRLLRDDIADRSLHGSVTAKIVAGGDPRRHAEAMLLHAERLGARLVVPGDDEWPAQVDDLAAVGSDPLAAYVQVPPLCLWVRGQPQLGELTRRSVAVVGARAATQYGRQVASDIAAALAENDWTIVAGGAFGVDAAAHRAALAVGGRTAVVLACGVDRPYPAGNAALFEQIVDSGSGVLISEWPLRSEPLKHRFLIRNRIVAAVAAGAVLVEAAPRSGSLQMMDRVLALHRPAMVVPGPVTSAMSVGCHELLRSHTETTLVTGPAQVLETLSRDEASAADLPREPGPVSDQRAQVIDAAPGKTPTT
ncbi:DNA-processing protein DprA [Paractinoplanes toevensis]|uniref:DNA processing protein DprA n=1 Tax=Paractinoplanes toevensis TaxID=571911 RepID=A0A919THX4_9ACTN|nr:DNA-processing protein DprA [Actinoplanes toevensis]GIM94379.1 putative DNA processing protein DprA [Actinoplanes toevensis]